MVSALKVNAAKIGAQKGKKLRDVEGDKAA